MIILSRVKSATSEFVKILRYGKNDVQTSDQYLPAGIDSKPVKEQMAVQGTTSDKGETVILGYLIESDKTNPGEFRIFATDSDGVEVFSMYFKNDGTVEFGGNADNLIRFTGLNTALQTFIGDLNTKLAAAFTALGGSWPGTSLDISGAKIDEIKSS